MTKEAPAPEAIVQMDKGGCQKNRCSNNLCHCRKSGLNYTYLCSCCDSDDPCKNACEDSDNQKIEYEDSDSEE